MNRVGSTSLEHHPSRLAAVEERLAAAGERLRAHVRAAARRANATRAPVIAWISVGISSPDPVELFGRGMAAEAEPMFWERPADGFSLTGIGRAWEFTAEGPDRFEQARDAWQRALAGAVGDDVASPEARTASGQASDAAGPMLMGGFSFSPGGPSTPGWSGFAAASLVLPRIVVSTEGSEGCATLSVVVHPAAADLDDAAGGVDESLATLRDLLGGAAAPREEITGKTLTREEITPAAEWKSLVARAAEAVRRRDLTKVVVARSLKVSGAGFDPMWTLRRLKADYPTCTIFAIARDNRCFLGATPERLVRVRGGDVSAMALAGSAPRGRTDDEDRRFGEALLASPKERVEHAVVVETLREALDGACSSVTVAGESSLLKVPNVQHLYTPIAARLREGITILDLVGRLHPTPAVGGVPRQAALEWIHRHEGLDRGWYAGPIGWLDHRGDGEFAVAIRSALLAGGEALLYAGCGIVADSDPDAEYEESRLKLRPLLAALGANGSA
jgi:isochorismate synthase